MNLYLFVLFWWVLAIFVASNLFYPLFFAICGLLFRRKASDELPAIDGLKPITLLVPAYNESSVIKAKLENIDSLEYPPGMLRVIVASDGSSDGTQDIVGSHVGKRPLKLLDFQERRGKASVVNDAIAVCEDPWICLCDANVMFHPDALIRLGNRLSDSKVGAVTGDVKLASHESDFGRGESLYYTVERAIQQGESHIGSVMGVDGGMYLIKRELLKPVPTDTILDDFTISMRVIQQGFRIQYEPSAIADENGTPSSSIEYGRRKRVVRGAVQAISRGIYPSIFGQPIEFFQWLFHKFFRWLNPFLLIGIFILSLLLVQTSVWFQGLVVVGAILIACTLLAWFLPTLRSAPVIGVIYYAGLSHWAMLIGFFQGLSGKYSAVWNRTERKQVKN